VMFRDPARTQLGETRHNMKPIDCIEHIREQKLNDLGI